jgi:hypothetical protein
MKKKVGGITFDKLEHKSFGKYSIHDVKDYLVWEIPEAERVGGLTNGSFYGYIYKLGVASFLLVIVEAEKSRKER